MYFTVRVVLQLLQTPGYFLVATLSSEIENRRAPPLASFHAIIIITPDLQPDSLFARDCLSAHPFR
jgi:hypothetical protein